MAETRIAEHRGGGVLAAVSTAMVALHKEQFGRGPKSARSNFAGGDTLVCVLEDCLLPAERAMVELGEQQRVIESRLFMQAATRVEFVRAIESIVRRKVRAFASATDPAAGVVWEIFTFEPVDVPRHRERGKETPAERTSRLDEQAEIDREVRESASG